MFTISWIFLMNKSSRRILLQQLIKMSFWNINILFRTKTFSSQLRVFGAGILKCETIDPWQASEPESEANTVLWQELIQKRCEECMQQMWSGLWIQGFKYPDQDEMCVWHELTTNAAFRSEKHFHCWML